MRPRGQAELITSGDTESYLSDVVVTMRAAGAAVAAFLLRDGCDHTRHAHALKVCVGRSVLADLVHRRFSGYVTMLTGDARGGVGLRPFGDRGHGTYHA
jgi:hypothetical protein